MKIIKLTILFTISIFLISCGDDDTAATVDGLDGDWTAVSFNVDVKSSTTTIGGTFESTSTIEGENLDYDLSFDEGIETYVTNGGYDLIISSSSDGMSQTATENFSNVSGSGNYTTVGDQITVRGSFFDFEVSGVDISEFQEEATATYEINSDGQLRFTQDETLSPVVSPDVTSTSSIRSVSVWERK